jgi:geranylgeranyl transferase type-1 subunit beta
MSLYPGNGHDDIPSLEALSFDDLLCVGCNGRLNKRPDTCYSWWVGGSLEMLGEGKLISEDGNRIFLLEETQHRIGGFGKEPGYPPGKCFYFAY